MKCHQLCMMGCLWTILLGMTVLPDTSFAAHWSLASSLKHAVEHSPELEKSAARIEIRQIDKALSHLWPDPEVSVRFDNRLGKEDGSAGIDLTDITLTQSLPYGRISEQQAVADAGLLAARFAKAYAALMLENRVARLYHRLQYAQSEWTLAKKQLELARKLNRHSQGEGSIVRYLTPLEKLRLSLILEEARQAAMTAEGKFDEARSEFARQLFIPVESIDSVTTLSALESLPTRETLLRQQQQHVKVQEQRQRLQKAKHQIEVARQTQTIDPSIGVSWSKDFLANRREDVYAILFNLQIPISDRVDKAVTQATYRASEQKIELLLIQRQLRTRLLKSLTHLKHITTQAAEYKTRILEPAKQMLVLTQKGFNSGELNILSLVDANSTYFQARLRYVELLYQAWTELADVRLYAGRFLAYRPVAGNTQDAGGEK